MSAIEAGVFSCFGGRFWVTAEGAREIMEARQPRPWSFAWTFVDGDPGYCREGSTLAITDLKEAGPTRRFPGREHIIRGEITFFDGATRPFCGFSIPEPLGPLYPCGESDERKALCVEFYFEDASPESLCFCPAAVFADLTEALT